MPHPANPTESAESPLSLEIARWQQACTAQRRQLAADPHWPRYHLTAPQGWMNDPCGPTYWQGQYHLFYQWDPEATAYPYDPARICWGHAVSDDLVHWRDLPIAVWPDSPWDRGGAHSGNIVIDDQGRPTMLYTGTVVVRKVRYGMLARSTDNMLTWQKQMVIDATPPWPGTTAIHDAHVWKENGLWWWLTGGNRDGKGATPLYSSPDLEHWNYRSCLFTDDRYANWFECPCLIPLCDANGLPTDQHEGTERFMLLACTHPVRYWVGTYNRQTLTFTPDDPEADIIDYSNTLYAPNPDCVDDRGPGSSTRRLMFGWVLQGSPTANIPYWEGVQALPRVLTWDGARLIQQPIPELAALREEHHTYDDLHLAADERQILPELRGDSLEIIAEFDLAASSAHKLGLELRCAADGQTATRIWYDTTTGEFGVDGNVSLSAQYNGVITGGPAGLEPGQPLRMHLFLDRSVLEVFVNGYVQTERLFADEDCLGVTLFAEGDEAVLRRLDGWRMGSIW